MGDSVRGQGIVCFMGVILYRGVLGIDCIEYLYLLVCVCIVLKL